MPPRSSLRQRAATPARSARAVSALPQDTPGARRTTRNASRQSLAPRDAVSNPALPEIQTQQSYAYGSSKTPALPEQLQAREMSMRAVADRLNDAASEAERNLEAHAAEVRGSTPESQRVAREARAQRRASREPSQQRSPPAEIPDESRRKDRTAAWIESSHLEDISEEESRQQSLDREPETPARDREASLPSSFPTGSFANHSYRYERGERGPNLPPPASPERSVSPERRVPSERRVSPERGATTPVHARITSKLKSASQSTMSFSQMVFKAIVAWLMRILAAFKKSMQELPDSPAISALFKAIVTITILSLCGFAFCSTWTRFCDSNSTSIVSQSLQKVCGSCSTFSTPVPSWNLTTADPNDLSQLIAALHKTQTQIAQIENRLNSRIDTSHASHSSDISTLRAHQEVLQHQIQQLSQHQPFSDPTSSSSSNDVSSPLINQINFFSPSNNAVVLPHLTSPTLSHHPSKFLFLLRVALNMVGFRKRIGHPPITALESWTEEGDRWCAAAPQRTIAAIKQAEEIDSIRLGVQTNQHIYPTELVIEHFPSSGSLEPEVAPKDIELWADFSKVSYDQWEKLHVKDLVEQSPKHADFLSWLASRSAPSSPRDPPRQTWARIGTATYHTILPSSNNSDDEGCNYEAQEVNANQAYLGQRPKSTGANPNKAKEEKSHVQRFNLQINQNGLLHYSDRFLVRVKNNYGGAYTCLYRVRLHGLPVDRDRTEERREL